MRLENEIADINAQTDAIVEEVSSEKMLSEREKFQQWWDGLNRAEKRAALKRMPRETRMAWKNRNRSHS